MKRFFKTLKQQISFEEYLRNTLIIAKRIVSDSGKQRYSSAQLELALVAFADLTTLKQEMDDDIEVEFPELECDWIVGFDWLDLSVSFGDEDAIEYFKSNMQRIDFSTQYEKYKKKYRPDCALQLYEENGNALEF
ncbi:hypothetical protein DGG96_14640 [Legionella qingyii]|uniref:Uncharacterized protein n=1 Tax=Legionella qingyii TaxID=2184757 RepID=A0A317U226_9GAMM|nr:hypothetical protein [Legionella qingyii]PWY54857.1 hypothetical protein DGG96_14640 [Legionella qingyii]RUR20941.1 hypothetical protein ELY20_14150 [Legionella qingyii]RUR23209.1 hypothetical protein ELY16_13515 [Legionella qingyii]